MPKIDILSFSVTKDFLKQIAGDDSIKLVEIVNKKKKNVTDEEIGKKMKHLKITEIRTVLNRLHYRGIACYQKTRDTRSGWYSYTWEIKNKRIAELVIEHQAEEIQKLEEKSKFAGEHEFFSCPGTNCDLVAFEIAAEYHFKCPKCGKQMDLMDKNKRLKLLKAKTVKIKTEINLLEKFI
ncbi:MAG TPA: hypothetical protein VJK05_03690 [archaeon]|nr:hypothetical protein [archaeon]